MINAGQTPTFHKFQTGSTLLFKFPQSLHLYSKFYFPAKQHGVHGVIISRHRSLHDDHIFGILFVALYSY
jgi:hypothetical protein